MRPGYPPHKPTVIKAPTANPNQIDHSPASRSQVADSHHRRFGCPQRRASGHLWLRGQETCLTASTWTGSSTPTYSARAVADGGMLMRRLGRQRSHRTTTGIALEDFHLSVTHEALQIHEILIIPGLRHQVHPALASTWVVPYTGLALILLWRFRRFLGSIPPATTSRLLRAGAVYISGAIGMEMIGSFAVRSSLIRLHSPWYGAITGLEETLELLGIILLIDALIRALLEQKDSVDLTLRLTTDPKKR